jgi:hypothetical protein
MKFPNWISEIAVAALLMAGIGCGKQASTPVASTLPNSDQVQNQPTQSAPFANASTESASTKAESTSVKLAKKSPIPEEVVIPSGTAITVRLQNAVSSATSRPGDQFEATLDQPVVVDGQTIAPEGAHVLGHVVAARHSGRLMHPGYLRIALSSMMVNGKTIPVQSSSVMVAGGSHKHRNLAWIGGGAGGGALIGAIATGGTGALIGSAIGAAGGTTTAFATGKKDVGFGAERRLTFRLTRPVTIA